MDTTPDSGVLLRITAAGGPDALPSLRDWLLLEGELSGLVRESTAPAAGGGTSDAPDELTVAMDAGGSGAALARSLSAWLDHGHADAQVTVTGPDGRSVEVDASRIRDVPGLTRRIGLLTAEVRFLRDHPRRRPAPRATTPAVLVLPAVFLIGSAVLAALVNHNALWLWLIPILGGVVAVAVKGITALVVGPAPQEGELVVDRSGITVHLRQGGRAPVMLRTAWSDISHVGVLRPRPGSVGMEPAHIYEANHMLVVRLRPGVRRPPTPRNPRFSHDLNGLGYRVIATIGFFGAGREQVLAALDRFAGDRVLHSEREFLDRDPRVQVTMI
jgi:membrane-associated two-gene conflict system component 1 (EACC1)